MQSCVLHLLYCMVAVILTESPPPTSGAGTVCVIWSHGQTPPGQLPELRGKLAPTFLHSQPTCTAGIELSYVCVLAIHAASMSFHHPYVPVLHPSLLPSLHVPYSETLPPYMPLKTLLNYLTPPPLPSSPLPSSPLPPLPSPSLPPTPPSSPFLLSS